MRIALKKLHTKAKLKNRDTKNASNPRVEDSSLACNTGLVYM